MVNADNTVAVRPVKLGPTDGGFTAVLSGLQPGERVVIDGTDRLRDGAEVTVPTAAERRGRASAAASPARRRRRRPAPPRRRRHDRRRRPDRGRAA